MTETQFTDRVIQTATLFGWLVCHFRPARTERGWRTAIQGDSGFPDLVMARGGVVLFRELKVGTKKPRPDQVSWGEAIGEDYALWYPDDWDEIVQTLRR
jgi:hypothetical protein